MEYVVLKSGGKQYKVSKGDKIEVDNLNAKANSLINLTQVLLYNSDGKVVAGDKKTSGITVKAKVVGNVKGEKIDVAKFKAKARSRRKIGFRAKKTVLQIEKIVSS